MAMIDWFTIHPDIQKEIEDHDPPSYIINKFIMRFNLLASALWALTYVTARQRGDQNWFVDAMQTWIPLVLVGWYVASNAALAHVARSYAARINRELRPIQTYDAVVYAWRHRRGAVGALAMMVGAGVLCAWGGHTGIAAALLMVTTWLLIHTADGYTASLSAAWRSILVRDVTDVALVTWYRASLEDASERVDREAIESAYDEVQLICGGGVPLEKRIADVQATTTDRAQDAAAKQAAEHEMRQAQAREAARELEMQQLADDLYYVIQVVVDACEAACISRASTPGMSVCIARRMTERLRCEIERKMALAPAIQRAIGMSHSWYIAMGSPAVSKSSQVDENGALATRTTFDIQDTHYVTAVLAVLAERVTPVYLEPADKKAFRLIPNGHRKSEVYDTSRWYAVPNESRYTVHGKMLTTDERHEIADHVQAHLTDIRNPALRVMLLQFLGMLTLQEPQTAAPEQAAAHFAIAGRR